MVRLTMNRLTERSKTLSQLPTKAKRASQRTRHPVSAIELTPRVSSPPHAEETTSTRSLSLSLSSFHLLIHPNPRIHCDEQLRKRRRRRRRSPGRGPRPARFRHGGGGGFVLLLAVGGADGGGVRGAVPVARLPDLLHPGSASPSPSPRPPFPATRLIPDSFGTLSVRSIVR